MNFGDQTAIVVTTYYPTWYKGKIKSIAEIDKVRGDIALQFIDSVGREGYHLVLVDGKSSESFLSEISRVGKVHIVEQEMKRSPRKRLALRIASAIPSVKAIVLTEPEKLSLIPSIPLITKPIQEGNADIVIPKRNDALFRLTYPPFQYDSETKANKRFNEMLRSYPLLSRQSDDFDAFFGPRVMKNEKDVVEMFIQKFAIDKNMVSPKIKHFDPEEYGNTLYFPIALALRAGLRVVNVEIPFSYPQKQKENEEQGSKKTFVEKRNEQSEGILANVDYFLSSLKEKDALKIGNAVR